LQSGGVGVQDDRGQLAGGVLEETTKPLASVRRETQHFSPFSSQPPPGRSVACVAISCRRLPPWRSVAAMPTRSPAAYATHNVTAPPRRIRVEHDITHLKNWRAPTRHLGRREHMSHTVQAVAGPLSPQQTGDLTSAQQ
jgi:hypothetical protein